MDAFKCDACEAAVQDIGRLLDEMVDSGAATFVADGAADEPPCDCYLCKGED